MLLFDSNMPSITFYTSIGSKSIARTTTDLCIMDKCVNLLLIRMEKQGSEGAPIISLLKKIFEKHFKVYHKFLDTVDKFKKLFALKLFWE